MHWSKREAVKELYETAKRQGEAMFRADLGSDEDRRQVQDTEDEKAAERILMNVPDKAKTAASKGHKKFEVMALVPHNDYEAETVPQAQTLKGVGNKVIRDLADIVGSSNVRVEWVETEVVDAVTGRFDDQTGTYTPGMLARGVEGHYAIMVKL
jgi:hypothetical protein